MAVDPLKVTSVINWPIPKNAKGVRGFLGLTRYYRKFILNYGKIAKPLTDLTKKEGFSWTESAAATFEDLKKAVSTAPVLALPYFSIPFESTNTSLAHSTSVTVLGFLSDTMPLSQPYCL